MRRFGLGFVSLLAMTGVALAQDMPPRKAGLWTIEMTVSGGQMPPNQMKMCIDAATDAEMQRFGHDASQGICSRHDVARVGDTVTVDTTCKLDQTEITTHAVTVFTSDTAYHSEIHSHMNPPMMGQAERTMTQDAKWRGACPKDMVPGDIEMANGMKMNVRQMARPGK